MKPSAKIHSLIDLVDLSMRIRKGREFFNVTPETALRIFKQCTLTLDDAENTIIDPQENKDRSAQQTPTATLSSIPHPHPPHSQKATKLTFAILGIPIGSELSCSEDPSMKAYTTDNNTTITLDDGTRTSLSGGVVLIKRRLGTATSAEAYQGENYWLYNGERLTSIRKELEQ